MAVPATPPPENKLYYPALDGIRALAVLAVFVAHYLEDLPPPLRWGWAGVDIFFVLSGFLITGILYDTRNTENRFRVFYARRTLRIFPLYYGILLFGALLTPIFHWIWSPAWVLWFVYLGNYARFIWISSPLFARGALEHLMAQPPYHHLTFLYLGHLWSLCVEEQFYLVWPLVVFSIRDRVRLRRLCLVVICATLLARIVCVFTVPKVYLDAGLLYRVTPLRIDAFLIGGLAALCLRGTEAKRMLRMARPTLLLFVAGFAAWEILYRALSGLNHFFYPDTTPVLMTIGYTLIDLFAAVLIVSVLRTKGVLFRIFDYRWARELGKISYGFYVFHDVFHGLWMGIAKNIVKGKLGAEALSAVFALVGTTVIAYLSYRYFETPFLRLKSRFMVKS